MLPFVIERYIKDKIIVLVTAMAFVRHYIRHKCTDQNTLFWLKDFHPSDIERFASCGMDNTVKIWSMKGWKTTSE